MRKVDRELLKKEKMIYGDNLKTISENWSKYLGVKITPKDVAMMKAQAIDTEIKFIQDKLNDLKDKPSFLIDNDMQEAYKLYKTSLDKNTQKKANYLFIATNYDEYLKL